jgi:hypothetical protein
MANNSPYNLPEPISFETAIEHSSTLIPVMLKLDPAFGSGPLATVIQDLLSSLIYFVIMTSGVRSMAWLRLSP